VKKTKSQKKQSTPIEPALAWDLPLTPDEHRRAVLKAHNGLLARHAILHSAMESFHLLRREDRANRIPLLRTCCDAVRAALTDATGTANHAKETLSRADLAELHRTIATLTRALPEYQRQIDRYQ